MAELTPMMKQYFQIKENYPDTILMFRLGDFYEMFFDDAKKVSAELDLVLTGRDCGQEERAPMCGVPFHSADSYIARLVAKGYKVAICEQLEDPALAKGIVKRDVTRVLTPGTVIESTMLDEGKNNFLACIFASKHAVGLCFADISTGSVHVTQFERKNSQRRIINELGRFNPSEIIINSDVVELTQVTDFVKTRLRSSCDMLDDSCFDLSKASATILRHFNVTSLSQLSLDGADGAVSALGAVMDYLREVQKSELENIRNIDYYGEGSFMRLDVSTLRNLEITETMRNREKRGSLLWVLDKAKTSMGKRMLRSWLEQPLLSIAKITKRHNAVDEFVNNPSLRDDIIESLSGCQDLERLITRIAYSTANARELKGLSSTLARLPAIKAYLSSCKSSLLAELCGDIVPLEELVELIDGAIIEEPPFSIREGGMIKDGFNTELDSLRDILNNGKGYIADIQLREQERTGIKKLKIGYNRVFGYYIEVSNSFKELVPEDYIRKQTLTNCERFITQELKELESKVLGAQERIVKLEYEIFDTVRNKAAEHLFEIQKTAAAVAAVDVLCSFARVANENNYCCPSMNASDRVVITDGRHPVVEKVIDFPFVPNDTVLDCSDNRCAIITGPNMAGKSTFMRQVALICLMAQAGSFVPALSAELCVVDGIFTRIGASDDLASGSSTFMVEMTEVADILKNATSKSLIIFDEIGRGTSTFDGMSIARAVLEYSADKRKLGAKTLFATHYHELTELENSVSGVKNYSIAVKKRGDDITFLRRIVSGCADGSYGIEVAKLAGVPSSVVERAKIVLKELEGEGLKVPVRVESEPQYDMQMSFGSTNANDIVEKLKKIDVNTLTPIEAMSVLYELAKQANT
ncbi:MAG: DNA mismatch repair protein MutS [Acutalibacteraceae bacterium]|nr:DNA mismatch repair protein MutS [Acutalibacteraceae bacterium]